MRLYRILLFIYPAAFRAEYEEELCHVFSERRRESTTFLWLLGLWLETLGDLLSNALRVHWDILRQDLRYALRTLGRARGFALTAVVVTGLGIGANTAVFSITDHVLIRPLPFADSERLVKIWESPREYSRMEASPPNYRDWRERSASFEAMGAYFARSVNLLGIGDPRRLQTTKVTADVFALLDTGPFVGRVFSADDDTEGAPGTVVLSYGLWLREFGGDRAVLSRELRLNDSTYSIIGVMPQNFYFPSRETALWMPMQLGSQDFEDRDNNYFQTIARLKPDVSLEEARAEMSIIAGQLELEYPETNTRTGATVRFLRDEVPEQSRLLLAALFAASACVLLITCTNLGNLLLARTLGRRKELTIRTAIGAGRERLVRQLLTESLVLVFLGGALGVLVAIMGLPLLTRLVPMSLPIGDPAVLDFRVLVFAGVLTGLTGIGFGVIPALRISSGARAKSLLEIRNAGVGGRNQRFRSVLVIVEVALSLVLLISSGLLIRALWQVQDIDPGFRGEGVLTLRTELPMPKYYPTARRAQLYTQVLSEVRSLPGVSSAAYVSFLPMVMRGGVWPVGVDGLDVDGPPDRAILRYATPGFFETLSIPLTAGRDLSEFDTDDVASVAVVSQSFARRYWPGEDPLGRSFNFAFRDRVVAGVVGDIHVRGLEARSEPQVYLPYKQVPDGSIIFYAPKDLVVRSSQDPDSLIPDIRRIVREADPELPVSDIRLLADIVDSETAPRRTQIIVLAAFAALSMLLAGIGIHSLLSFGVSQRTGEIGVRMAMGARSGDILRMVFREGVLLAVVGGVVGLGAAYTAGRMMEALLAGVRPGDAVTFLAAVGLALAMTVTGSLLPALRAARVDPTEALRAE